MKKTKKILVMLLTATLLLSLGAVYASAEPIPEWIDPALVDSAVYMIGSEEDFNMLGDVEIQWDPDAADKLGLADMSMQDWIYAGYDMTVIDASNMIAWVGDETTFDENWGISTYFVSDGEWLYIGFYVTDSTFTYADRGYNGDAFSLCIDFGGKLGDVLDEDPYLLTNPKNIFYSFSCKEDGAPLEIVRQESEDNRTLTEANGDGVMGTAYQTSSGWSAEFALSLEMLYDDYVWKAYENDPTIYVGGEEELPLTIGCSLYYMDRYYDEAEETNRTLWTAGASNGRVTDENGNPVMTYTAYDNGINLYLPYREGLHFACENLVVVDPGEGIPGDGTTTTDPWWDDTTTTVEPDNTTNAIISGLWEQISQLQQQVADLEADYQAALNRLEESQNKLEQTQKELEKAKKDAQKAWVEHGRVQAQLEQTQAELEQAQSELEQTQSELEQAQSELEQALSELDAAEERNAELEKELDELRQYPGPFSFLLDSSGCASSLSIGSIVISLLIGAGVICLLRKKDRE